MRSPKSSNYLHNATCLLPLPYCGGCALVGVLRQLDGFGECRQEVQGKATNVKKIKNYRVCLHDIVGMRIASCLDACSFLKMRSVQR